MIVLTKDQRLALKNVYDRDWDKPDSYLTFRRTVFYGFGYIMVPWCGMDLGIEPNGHTHS